MIKLKPSNIFQYYAPTGSVPKIADFALLNNFKTETAAAVIATGNSTDLPGIEKKDNIWGYILIGAVIIAGIAILVKINRDEEKEKEVKLKNNVYPIFYT